jgi:hypothetical protein
MALRVTEFDESQVTAAIACTEASRRRGRNRSGSVEAVREYEPGVRERTDKCALQNLSGGAGARNGALLLPIAVPSAATPEETI